MRLVEFLRILQSGSECLHENHFIYCYHTTSMYGQQFYATSSIKRILRITKKNFKTEEPTQIPKISPGRDVQSLIDKSV